MNLTDKITFRIALMWQKRCEELSGGCEDCPKQGDCITAKELILEKLNPQTARHTLRCGDKIRGGLPVYVGVA